MTERRRGRPPHPDVLTPAEARVLEELRRDGTNAEIAIRLGLSPETVKTHISNMLAKLELEDRQQLARWREGDAPRRRWTFAVLMQPLVATGVAAGAAVVIGIGVVVALVLLPRLEREPDPLTIEGVGEVAGPVIIYVAKDVQMRSGGSFEGFDTPYAFAFEPATGKEWVIPGVATEKRGHLGEHLEFMAVAGDRLVVWDREAVHEVTLDGRRRLLTSIPDGTITGLIVSPDATKVALAINLPGVYVDGHIVYPADSIVVLDLQSGDELLRVVADDPRIADVGLLDLPPLGSQVRRWSADGTSLWANLGRAHVILSLDGDLRAFPADIVQTTFSSDLRHAIVGSTPRGGALLRFTISGDGRRGPVHVFTEAPLSLKVIEVDTGRVVFMKDTTEGHVPRHVAGPFSGRYIYSATPGYPVNLDYPTRQGNAGWWVSTTEQGVLHEVDLATGEVRELDDDDEDLLAEARLEREREVYGNRTGEDRCLAGVAAYEACQRLLEEPLKGPGGLGFGRLIKSAGVIWLNP